MTDTSKRELIERAAKALYEANWGDDFTFQEDRDYWMSQARAAFAVFEQAHAKELDTSPEPVKNGADSLHVEQAQTPTDVELAKAANDAYHAMVDEAEAEGGAWWGFSHQRDAWEDGYQQGLAAGLRRTAVPEPSGFPAYFAPKPPMTTNRFASEPQGEPKHDASCGERCNHCSACGEAILYGSRCAQHYLNQPQGESADVPTVQLAARRGGKTQAMIDSMLAQANERGIRVEVVYPQGKPTEAQVVAALDAYDDARTNNLAERGDAMHAALTAAYETKGESRG